MDKKQKIITRVKRVVVKIGSSILVGPDGLLSHKALLGVARGIAAIQKKDVHVTLVSSGAIASGMQYLGFRKKPKKISELQACAAIGQPILMQMYQKALAGKKLQVAQILLTRQDLSDRSQFSNAKHTLSELLKRNVIPIINENDTVVVEEIRVGDNDNLAALVSGLARADLLILLTDQDGFFTADPRKNPKARRIALVERIDRKAFARASGTNSLKSVGGMKTKLEAAQTAARFGIPTVVAHGRGKQVLEGILAGKPIGTFFAVKS